jgi:hypothetical protein
LSSGGSSGEKAVEVNGVGMTRCGRTTEILNELENTENLFSQGKGNQEFLHSAVGWNQAFPRPGMIAPKVTLKVTPKLIMPVPLPLRSYTGSPQSFGAAERK